MAKVDMNKLAVKITKAEGLKKSLSIGQVKEVMKLTLTELAKMNLSDLGILLGKYRK